MEYNNILVSDKLKKWERFLDDYSLPSWEELPSLELYMDQVIILLTQHLSFMPQDEASDKLITSSIINNYVRMRLIPAPVRKKYSRVHLAYLIMICTLKQSLSISYIQKILPLGLSDSEIRDTYTEFVRMYKRVSGFFLEQARIAAAEVMPDPSDVSSIPTFIMSAAVVSSLSKFLAEKLVNLKNAAPPSSDAKT